MITRAVAFERNKGRLVPHRAGLVPLSTNSPNILCMSYFTAPSFEFRAAGEGWRSRRGASHKARFAPHATLDVVSVILMRVNHSFLSLSVHVLARLPIAAGVKVRRFLSTPASAFGNLPDRHGIAESVIRRPRIVHSCILDGAKAGQSSRRRNSEFRHLAKSGDSGGACSYRLVRPIRRNHAHQWREAIIPQSPISQQPDHREQDSVNIAHVSGLILSNNPGLLSPR